MRELDKDGIPVRINIYQQGSYLENLSLGDGKDLLALEIMVQYYKLLSGSEAEVISQEQEFARLTETTPPTLFDDITFFEINQRAHRALRNVKTLGKSEKNRSSPISELVTMFSDDEIAELTYLAMSLIQVSDTKVSKVSTWIKYFLGEFAERQRDPQRKPVHL